MAPGDVAPNRRVRVVLEEEMVEPTIQHGTCKLSTAAMNRETYETSENAVQYLACTLLMVGMIGTGMVSRRWCTQRKQAQMVSGLAEARHTPRSSALPLGSAQHRAQEEGRALDPA